MAGLAYEDVRFFGGQVRVDQPKTGYRAGTDAILLAMAISAKPEAKILDIGTGSGILPCLLNHRFSNCEITGLDNNPDMLALARRNTKAMDNVTIIDQDAGAIPKSMNQGFDVAVSNPPFFDDINAVRISAAKQSSFVSETLSLKAWTEAMVLMLKPRGVGALICRADRLETVFAGLYLRAGRIRILPIQSYANTPANRVLISFRKGVKSESQILPPLVMHDKNNDMRYSQAATEVLNGKIPIIMG